MRAVFKLALVLVAGFSLVIILLAAVFGAALALLLSVISGRKPKLMARVTRFKQTAGEWNQYAGSPSAQQPASASLDVVDVEAREVSNLPADSANDSTSQKVLR